MTSEQLRRYLEVAPFQPFRVHMPNGRCADVPHPEFMHVFAGGRFASVVHPDETIEVTDVFLITSIHRLPSNARKRRRLKHHRPN
jgi:hypothetical protein